MNFLYIGKSFPTIGGVARRGIETVAALEEAGHHVCVVSNSFSLNKLLTAPLLDSDQDYLSKVCPRAWLSLSVSGQETNSNVAPYSAPEYKLLGRALAICDQARPDVIFCNYLFPFLSVAAELKRRYGAKLIAQHAGSDLFKIATDPDVLTALNHHLSNVDFLISPNRNKPVSEAIKNLAFPAERVISPVSPPRLQNSQMDFNQILSDNIQEISTRLSEIYSVRQSRSLERRILNKEQGRKILRIGMCSKSLPSYRYQDVFEVLTEISLHHSIEVYVITGGNPEKLQRFLELVESSTEYTNIVQILPLFAPWHISSFFSFCDIVLHLEENHSVDAHRSSVPMEVFHSGRPLILSAEVARKCTYSESLVNWKNCIITETFRDREYVSSSIERLLVSPSLRMNIGSRAKHLASNFHHRRSRGEFVKFWERFTNSASVISTST